MNCRDSKTKQAFIEYLQQETDERFFQALSNFCENHGLTKHFIVTTDRPELGTDLYFMEADDAFKD